MNKHVTIAELAVAKAAEPASVMYQCPGCGADAGCNCGLPPILKARQAIAENPDKSDRVLAAETGVSRETVRRARSGDTSVSPEKRKGKDGKSYKAKRKAAAREALQQKQFAAYMADFDPTAEASADDPPSTQFELSLSARLGDLISAPAYYDKHLPEWRTYELPSHVQKLISEAQEVLDQMRPRKEPAAALSPETHRANPPLCSSGSPRPAAKALAAHRLKISKSSGPNEWQEFSREWTLSFSKFEDWFNKLMAKEVPPSAEMVIMGLMQVSKLTQNWGYRLNEKTGGSHDIEVPPCNR